MFYIFRSFCTGASKDHALLTKPEMYRPHVLISPHNEVYPVHSLRAVRTSFASAEPRLAFPFRAGVHFPPQRCPGRVAHLILQKLWGEQAYRAGSETPSNRTLNNEVPKHLPGKTPGALVLSRNRRNSSLGRGQPLGVIRNI